LCQEQCLASLQVDKGTIPLYLVITYQFFTTYIKASFMALTKRQIAQSVQQGTGTSLNQAYQLVETTLGIKNILASGEDVLISGLGKFKVNEKSARKGRNPATGEAMILKPRKEVTFHCSGKLRERVNEDDTFNG
jgi:integration host factor subunit alpha